MYPPIVNDLIAILPKPADVAELQDKLLEVHRLLHAAAQPGKKLTPDQQAAVLRRLDRGLSAWRAKKRHGSEFNSLCGLYEVARSLEAATRLLHKDLETRLVVDTSPMIQQIVDALLGPGSLLELPPRQIELMNQVVEAVLRRTTAGRLTPGLMRPPSDDTLASLSDAALESLPQEDPVIVSTRKLVGAMLRFAKSFQQARIDLDLDKQASQLQELKCLIDGYKLLEEKTYDICELIHDHGLIDIQQLSESNQSFFRYLFPSEIRTIEPTDEMRGAWREAALERQIRADMEDTLRECIRLNPVANALMAEYAINKDQKIYEEARWMVLPEARSKLELRLSTSIFNKATDEVEKKEIIHRYPVEIPAELTYQIKAGQLDAAMKSAQALAVQLMKRFLADVYHHNDLVEP